MSAQLTDLAYHSGALFSNFLLILMYWA